MILVGDQHRQAGDETSSRHDQTFNPHRRASRWHRHVAPPGTVDVIEILEVRLVQIGFERLLKGGVGLREHAVERVEKILSLRHSVVAVVREARLLAGRQSGGEIARREARAKHQIAGAHRP